MPKWQEIKSAGIHWRKLESAEDDKPHDVHGLFLFPKSSPRAPVNAEIHR